MTYHYKDCGLDYVYLKNGYTEHETPYGQGVSIERADELHDVIARAVITSSHQLRGQEVRFLRSILKLSQAGLGDVLGISRATVARWEGAAGEPITSPGADRTLRLFFALKRDGHELAERICELLTKIDELKYQQVFFEETDESWKQDELVAA